MRAPTTSTAELTRAALRLAEEVEQAEAVVRIEVCLEGLGGESAEQLGLFDGQRRRKVALDRAVGQIQRRFGDRVKRVVVAESEWPGWAGLEPRLAVAGGARRAPTASSSSELARG